MDIPLWLRMVGLISQIATGFLTLAVFILLSRYTAKVTREIKRADVLMEVNRKFDALSKDCEELARQKTGDSRYYYERFWSLQSQQFQYWLQGYVTDNTFYHWMLNRKHDFTINVALCGITFRDGWDQAKPGHRFDAPFVELIEEMRKGADVVVTMKRYKPKLQLDNL
jgi:hypothetical protein